MMPVCETCHELFNTTALFEGRQLCKYCREPKAKARDDKYYHKLMRNEIK